jgi:hypothetical protein
MDPTSFANVSQSANDPSSQLAIELTKQGMNVSSSRLVSLSVVSYSVILSVRQ